MLALLGPCGQLGSEQAFLGLRIEEVELAGRDREVHAVAHLHLAIRGDERDDLVSRRIGVRGPRVT